MHRSIAYSLGLALALAACSKKPVPPPPTEPKVTMPPEPTAAALKSSIHVTSPTPVKVLLDGKPACDTTPCELNDVPPGDHDVTCVDPDGGPATSGVTLGEGQHVEQICPSNAIRR
ncbi:MAG: PEGA domain-containing protein [Myxococcales bacterium]|nr:PEGA domain-containing protein [Myxococcales bacterium]